MKKEWGQALVLPPFKGRIESKYNFSRFVEAFSDCGILLRSPACQILHEGRNRIGILAFPREDGGRIEIVVKEFLPRGINSLKSIFLRGKALKAWSGAQALLASSIDTPFPVAYLEKRKRFVLERGYFICERIEGVEELRTLFRRLSSRELQALLSALAAFLRSVHEKGILHRDLSDGNILVDSENSQKFRFYLIDTNRIRVKERISLGKRIKNLIRLGVPAETQSLFLSQYLESPEIGRRLWQWYRLNKSVFSGYVELKKKLKLKQLARKLGIQ